MKNLVCSLCGEPFDNTWKLTEMEWRHSCLHKPKEQAPFGIPVSEEEYKKAQTIYKIRRLFMGILPTNTFNFHFGTYIYEEDD